MMNDPISDLIEHAEESFQIEFSSGNDFSWLSTNTIGDTVLHVAVSLRNLDLVKFAIEKGIDVNKQGDFLETALHMACHNKDWDIVDFLIKKGADIQVENHFGQKPIVGNR